MAAEPYPPPPTPSAWARVWADLTRAGWQAEILRYAAHGVWLLFLATAFWSQGQDWAAFNQWVDERLVLSLRAATLETTASARTELPNASSVNLDWPLPTRTTALTDTREVVTRTFDNNIFLPRGGRDHLITYTVQTGDTLFGIAERFGLAPETVLWSNYFTLKDDPHLLFPEQVLNILPMDGAYHLVTEDNTLDKVARFYKVEPEAILAYADNNLDPQNMRLNPGTYLVIPGGKRELQVWVVPTITRETKTTAANNVGQCPGGYSGVVGNGTFIWPANNHFLSGYDYTAIHKGLDFKTKLGDPLYATDNGVVVYAGWNDFGYGNLVVLDHGNGWQSVYAHLSQWNVVCGESIYQGSILGLAGSTGRSSGPHLHFELRYNGAHVNPWTVLGP